MARPRKISEEVEQKILELLEKGLCVSHVAREVGLSDITIKRQRERDSGFNKRFLQDSKRGEDNIRNLKRLGIRTYRRNVSISPNYYDEASEMPSKASESHSEAEKDLRTWMGLSIHPRPMDYSVNTEYYLNPDTAHVEIIIDGVVRVCPMDLCEERHKPQRPEPFYGAVY
ncbi:hypothetical protein IKG06_00140 [Candidatus Saccharibacteria bacterium]|nr:hypothetical protein [Candidatus Saccharibacteria bacterium]